MVSEVKKDPPNSRGKRLIAGLRKVDGHSIRAFAHMLRRFAEPIFIPTYHSLVKPAGLHSDAFNIRFNGSL